MPDDNDGKITEEVVKTLERITKQVKSKEQKAKEFKKFGDALMQQVKEKRVVDLVKKINGITKDISDARSKVEKYTKSAKKSKDAKAQLKTWNETLRKLLGEFAVVQSELFKAVNDRNKSNGGLSTGGGGGGGKSDPSEKLMQTMKELNSIFSSVLKDVNEAAKQLASDKSSVA